VVLLVQEGLHILFLLELFKVTMERLVALVHSQAMVVVLAVVREAVTLAVAVLVVILALVVWRALVLTVAVSLALAALAAAVAQNQRLVEELAAVAAAQEY
jgi:hypothetical protein